MEKKINNIDEFVKQGLDGFEATPPVEAWDNIAERVQTKDRKLIPVFWQWAAAVVVMLGLSFLLRNFLFNPSSTELSQNQPVKTESITPDKKDISTDNEAKTNQSKPKLKKQDQKLINQDIKQKEVIQKPQSQTKTQNLITDSEISPKKSEIEIKPKITEEPIPIEKPLIAENSGSEKIIDEPTSTDDNSVLPEIMQDNSETQSIVIVPNDDQEVKEQVEDNKAEKEIIPELPKDLFADAGKQHNWSIGGGASPMYSFRTLSQKTDNISYKWQGGESNESNEHPIIAFTGGVDVEYQTNRWSFSSGLYYSQNGMETDNFNFNRLVIYNSQMNIYASTSAGNIAYEEVSNNVLEQLNINGTTDGPYLPNGYYSEPVESDATLHQDFEYLEIPFITKYKLIDRKIDVQLLAGVSTSFLIENTNILKYSTDELDMGKIENLRKVNYNSLLGLGFQYPFTESLNFRLQPLFRYALKPVNEDYSVNNFPYSFAIYTGFAFDF